ncbi:TetR/AcrR family transcriptional regulator [Qipengyuania sp.]|uniref:TetR/AcrR family transcriptional regulator n=1 Tax=Qipengyuania sp. TaxID=2004515 RepID=UPI0035C84959
MGATPVEGDREQQVLAEAEALILERRTLDLSLGEVADRVGVSRSLLYVYFDGVPAMVDALFGQHLSRLEARVFSDPDGPRRFDRDGAIEACAAYLDYLVSNGPILLLILRERHRDSPLGPASRRNFRRLLRRAARDISRLLGLTPREAFVMIELVAGIPEALARLAREGEITSDVAHATCRRLTAASIAAFIIEPAD